MFNIDQKINIRHWYKKFGIIHMYHVDMKTPKDVLWKLGNLLGHNYGSYIKGEALHGNNTKRNISGLFSSSR